MKVWFVSIALVACAPEPAGRSTDGADVYARNCVTCHGSSGRPTAAMIARLGVRDLTSPELRGRITPTLVEEQVRKGSTNKLMPSFERALTDAEIKAVAEYVAGPQLARP